MTKTVISYRRIDHLKAIALDRGFTNEDAKQFGKLSKTATWEALLETYGISFESVDTVDIIDNALDTVLDTSLEAVDTVDKGVDNKAQSHDTSDWTNDASFPVCNFTPQNSTNFLEVDTVDTLDTVLDTRLEAVDTVDTVDKGVDNKAQSHDTSDWTNDASFPVCNFTPQNSTNFLEWVDFGQFIALALASVGLFVLAMSLWRQINPLNLFPPVKVNIQIGTKL
jgi:hypothetical protein